MRVLSLFDGISCARVALERAGIPVESYYACEIEPNAIKVSQARHPDIVQLGDVRTATLPTDITLLIGGSPCQDLSIGKKNRQGLQGERSGLFWEYVRVLKEVKPRWFVLENVASMPKEAKNTISEALGVQPVLFDASLVSAQSRKRLFWTNLSFTLPSDKRILLRDILQPNGDVELTPMSSCNGEGVLRPMEIYVPEGESTATIRCGTTIRRYLVDGKRADNRSDAVPIRRIEVRNDDKCGPMTTIPTNNFVVDLETFKIRKLTPIECERLQGLPDGYTEGIAMTHRYKCLGNAFNVDVVAHILARIPK